MWPIRKWWIRRRKMRRNRGTKIKSITALMIAVFMTVAQCINAAKVISYIKDNLSDRIFITSSHSDLFEAFCTVLTLKWRPACHGILKSEIPWPNWVHFGHKNFRMRIWWRNLLHLGHRILIFGKTWPNVRVLGHRIPKTWFSVTKTLHEKSRALTYTAL